MCDISNLLFGGRGWEYQSLSSTYCTVKLAEYDFNSHHNSSSLVTRFPWLFYWDNPASTVLLRHNLWSLAVWNIILSAQVANIHLNVKNPKACKIVQDQRCNRRRSCNRFYSFFERLIYNHHQIKDQSQNILYWKCLLMMTPQLLIQLLVSLIKSSSF